MYSLRKYQHSRCWYAAISLPGKPRTNWRSTRMVKKDLARAVAEQWEREAVLGMSVLPLEKAIWHLRQELYRKHSAQATIDAFERQVTWLLRKIDGGTDVHKLTLQDIELYRDWRAALGVADATIAKELGQLRAALNRCRLLGLYKGEAAALWPPSLAKRFKGRTRWLTRDEYRVLVDVIDAKWRDHFIAYVMTGMRFSELYRLTTDDVHHAMLHIRGTKTEGSDRYVPISPTLREVLARRTTPQLFPLKHSTLQKQMREWLRVLASAARAAKIPHVRTNDLRRTFVSWCWHDGVDKEAVRRWVGHSSYEMIDTVYAQPSEAHMLEEMARFREDGSTGATGLPTLQ